MFFEYSEDLCTENYIRGHVPPHERNDGYVPGRVLDIRARGMIIYMDDWCHVETIVLLQKMNS